ncbi:MAG: Proton/glutamate-aspartate symporter [Chlamydiae bacterium]|nr:Proton/glutamate-aspartate symporter [Chlamydiota bacterium]
MKNQLRSTVFITLALGLGVLTGILKIPIFILTASFLSEIFLGALKLIGIPIVFLSIIATISGFDSLKEMKFLGRKVLKYTLLTTLIAATTALLFFIIIQPSTGLMQIHSGLATPVQPPFLTTLLQMFPTNFVEVFLENNVFGAALISAAMGFAILTLPEKQRVHLHTLFSSLFQALLKITSVIIRFIPIGIWAFTTLFLQRLIYDYSSVKPLIFYIICVVGANIVQGVIVLPILLKIKGVSPLKTLKMCYPALLTAFFSKSSSAALPLTIECSINKGKVSKKIANFSLPLCSVINMNGCAAFILITVLFVSAECGLFFSLPMMIFWVLLATLAAIGNASVPMGCYFLSSAFLVAMGVPIEIMGMILPIYAFIDMIETALNVWSDISVTTIVNKEAQQSELALSDEMESPAATE